MGQMLTRGHLLTHPFRGLFCTSRSAYIFITARVAEPGTDQRPETSISYSRKDSVFAKQLLADLTARRIEAYLHQKDTLPGEDRQQRLGALTELRSAA